MSEYLKTLEPLIRQKSNLTDAREFHARVNVIFHNEEAKHYDKLHTEMWESLPVQYGLLVADIKTYIKNNQPLKLLDVGCGTGLATQMLLDAGMDSRVAEIHLLDTSEEMLKQAVKRSTKWGKKVLAINGDVNTVQEQYDIILISSVLHHIPDLPPFLEKISSLQKNGGLLITIQDPAAEAQNNQVLENRKKEYQQYHESKRVNKTIIERAINKAKRLFKEPDYIKRVNKKLLEQKIINQPLTDSEIWSVTDIHVEGLPYSAGAGISKAQLVNYLRNNTLISYRTYGFYGTMGSNLDERYRKLEHELALSNDQNGRHFCSAWIKV
ncbi:class I SAM-dependent methyltransferase [Mucilaginibacter sp.]|uniref:class I SAM-dependent methyltransferase n=1 Tax=Mucilaginibacter sp. TaxID=1882438 RepID=UPI000CB73C26|nr:class I SAM-dependent methyltransferase [Mucilaginibacter sp.]PLW89678.1 MAG: hypothetical protein C0154_10395 [Mucilaginibacter sp.]PMP65174.1 MAG: hypothetical protein C0191_04365 [Mucilaginibacter sp.]HEK21146.1 class I SAM-dependent methyltransferase [Bacteroidota bacterium]